MEDDIVYDSDAYEEEQNIRRESAAMDDDDGPRRPADRQGVRRRLQGGDDEVEDMEIEGSQGSQDSQDSQGSQGSQGSQDSRADEEEPGADDDQGDLAANRSAAPTRGESNDFPSDAYNGGQGGVDTSDIARQQLARRNLLEQQQSEAGDAWSDAGGSAPPPQQPRAPAYAGYSAELLCATIEEDPNDPNKAKVQFRPYLPKDSNGHWSDVSKGMPPATQSEPGVKPARSVVINVLADFFRMDASEYRAMQSPTGHKERASQVAVLMGALFNGIQVGYVTGRLESMDRAAPANATDGGSRGKGKDPTHIQRRDRYTYRPTDHPDESWPCFQIGHEEVFDEDEKFLCAVRIWLHIYDPAFSLTQLLIAIMEFEGAVRDAMTVGVGKDVNPAMRSAAETARARISGGTAASDIHHNVEEHAAHQTQHLVNFSTWKMALEIYSGSTSNGHGCPVHPCLHQLVNCAAGRRQVTHDTDGLRGSYHPLAPEFLLNAKRPDALRAGLAHIDSGTPMAICAKQLDPANYFDPQGRFRLPDMGEKSFYWFWTGPDERSIWSLQLPRPLQGTVTPGPALCDAFLHRRYELKCEEARATGRPLPNEAEEMEHNQRTLAQFRSLALDADTMTAQRSREVRAALLQYDAPLRQQHGHNVLAGEHDQFGVGKDHNFEIRITPATDVVTAQNNRLYKRLKDHWDKRLARALKLARESAAPGPAADARERATRLDWQRSGYDLKADAAKYYLRLLDNSFRAVKERSTMPNGYLAMHDELTDQLARHGGSASIAFNGQGGQGKQMIASDRTVWGQLQEWLGSIFVGDCMIDGRDRRIMDELYLHAFEPYTNGATFILVVASEKGKGKSVRVLRMMRVMPKGWIQNNAGSSAKAGMNGNHSPNNGSVVFYDEVDSDLTPSECDRRMEYWKQIVTQRFVGIERTVQMRAHDGADTHVTAKIITDHRESHCVCTNMGPNFTKNSEIPDEGKKALIDRSICIFARAQTNEDSSDAAFEEHLAKPGVPDRLNDFKLFTCLVGFCRLAIRKCDWLTPDLTYAEHLWSVWDDQQVNEYNTSRSEARRLIKRRENCITMCLMEAVARIFLFRQSAMASEVGRPDPKTGKGQKFEPGMLWEVLRTAVPTREIIWHAWSNALEYNVTTSAHGVNVMTGLCSHAGLTIDGVLRRHPRQTAAQLEQPPQAGGAPKMWQLEKMIQMSNPCNDTDIDALEQQLGRTRRERAKARSIFRLNPDAAKGAGSGDTPAAMIRTALTRSGHGAPDGVKRITDALFPPARAVVMYYYERALLMWCNGKTVGVDEVRRTGLAADVQGIDCFGGHKAAKRNMDGGLSFATLNEHGSAQEGSSRELDFAWFALGDGANQQRSDTKKPWNKKAGDADFGALGKQVAKQATCRLFDMHVQGVADAIQQLSNPEHSRDCPEMPTLSYELRQAAAFKRHVTRQHDGDGRVTNPSDPGDSAEGLSVRPFRVYERASATGNSAAPPKEVPLEAHQTPGPNVLNRDRLLTDVRHGSSSYNLRTVPIHEQIDNLVNRGRLAAMLPHVSTNVYRVPPIRGMGGVLQLNAVVAYEHVSIQVEAALRCHRVPGLRGAHEDFPNGSSAPHGLCVTQGDQSGRGGGLAALGGRVSPGQLSLRGTVKKLPWSYDLYGIAASLWAFDRLHNEDFATWIEMANQIIAEEELGLPLQPLEGAVEFSMRFPAYPKQHSGSGKRAASEQLRLLTVPCARSPPPNVPVNLEDMQKTTATVQSFYEASTALGQPATVDDMEVHERSKTNTGNTRGVSGDIYAYSTWQKYNRVSMTERFVTPVTDDESAVSGVDQAMCEGILDCETLVFCRLLERRVFKNPTAPEHKGLETLRAPFATALTFGADEAVDVDEAALGKRRRCDENLGVKKAVVPCMRRPPPPPPPEDGAGCGGGGGSSSQHSQMRPTTDIENVVEQPIDWGDVDREAGNECV